jgi:hypothetical protein
VSKKEDVHEEYKKLHDEELHNLCGLILIGLFNEEE